MVPLGLGQAVLGGSYGSVDYSTKIYHMTCSQQKCQINTLSQELSVSRGFFVAIPIKFKFPLSTLPTPYISSLLERTYIESSFVELVCHMTKFADV